LSENTAAPPLLPPRREKRVWLGWLLIGIAVLSFVAGTWFLDGDRLLAEFGQRRSAIQQWVNDHPVLSSALYMLAYFLFTSLSLPGALFLTLAGGAVFPLWWGLLLVSFASTAGATASFLASRYFLRAWVLARYGARLDGINRELDREGIFYLLALRLNPAVPYFLINLLFGLTRMPARRFWWVSQLGMLPATVIYLNAGARLGEVQSTRDLVSWQVLVSLLALSVFPLAARKVANWLRS
jgi:uncharacterized membrane protein YdjX (TVP38/TMEM64 family)